MKTKNKIVKFLLLCILTLLGVFSLCYYASKFYNQKFLLLKESPMYVWVFMFTLLIGLLLLGIYNAYMVTVLKKQNDDLKQLIQDNFGKTQESIYNSRDVSIDIYNLLQAQVKIKSKENE